MRQNLMGLENLVSVLVGLSKNPREERVYSGYVSTSHSSRKSEQELMPAVAMEGLLTDLFLMASLASQRPSYQSSDCPTHNH